MDITTTLLDAKANPNFRYSERGLGPLHLAAQAWLPPPRSRMYPALSQRAAPQELVELEVAELLIQRGADPTQAAGDGSTPLHLAAAQGALPMVEMLLSQAAVMSCPHCVPPQRTR